MFSVTVIFIQTFRVMSCTSSQRCDQEGLCELKNSEGSDLGMSHANSKVKAAKMDGFLQNTVKINS